MSSTRLGLWNFVWKNANSCIWVNKGLFSPKDYFIAEIKLGFTECERDLGVLVSYDGTWHEQVNSEASKVNRDEV